MKRLLFLVVVFAAASDAVGQSHIGGGVGFYSYTTYWYRYNSGGSPQYTYPIHVFTRTQALGYFESSSIFSLGPLATSFRAEVHFGLSGDTKEDWLPSGETISSGGSTLGAALGIKLKFPIPLPTFGLNPYVTPMFHYTLLNSNGQGVGTQFANRPEYNYAASWEENIFAFSIGVGAEFRFVSIVVAPEYRFFVSGGASTDWDPTGSVDEQASPAFGAFAVTVGVSL